MRKESKKIIYVLLYDTKEDSRTENFKEFNTLDKAKSYADNLFNKKIIIGAQIEARRYQFNGKEWMLIASKKYDPLLDGSWYKYDWYDEPQG